MAITKERHRFKRGQIIRAVQTLTSGGKPYIEKGSEYVVNATSGDVWAYVKVIGSDNRGYDIHQEAKRMTSTDLSGPYGRRSVTKPADVRFAFRIFGSVNQRPLPSLFTSRLARHRT